MVNFTEEQYQELLRKTNKADQALKKMGEIEARAQAVVNLPKEKPGALNKTEQEFALYLSQHTGYTVLAQRIKFRLADLTWFTPDFVCFCMDGVVRIYETKGFMRDDAAVKLKVAAEQYWFFRWFLVTRIPKKKGGGWAIKPINQ